VLVLLAVLASAVILAGRLARSFSTLDETQVRRGLFGDAAREDLVRGWAVEVVEAAERLERLCYFQERLRDRAWSGLPLAVVPAGSTWTSWRFANGETWSVRQIGRRRRPRPRMIVGAAREVAGCALSVRVYEPRGSDESFTVCDAHLLANAGALPSSRGGNAQAISSP
jgi:hypothetical protein